MITKELKCALAVCACCLFPAVSSAQSFETIDACKSLRQEVTAAVEASSGLSSLMTDKSLTEAQYLEQLYEGVKILSGSGEMFFKASDSHESACKAMLSEAGQLAQVREIYDWYLEPVQAAYQFFRRAREAAVRLNRQGDVDVFSKTMTEYDAAVMKLVSVCEGDLANTASASTCAGLSAKLGDALK
ncbi:MAG: hypothetical protein IKY83_03150 [Proteobacteria bacterium]|nr:hypothetical protein [Pseudomonadota bacterium]